MIRFLVYECMHVQYIIGYIILINNNYSCRLKYIFSLISF